MANEFSAQPAVAVIILSFNLPLNDARFLTRLNATVRLFQSLHPKKDKLLIP